MKGLWRRLRELVDREGLDREAEEELREHVELSVADKVATGMDEGEARRRTRLELGDPEEARERLRDGRAGHRLDLLAKDLAYAGRTLRRAPGVSSLQVLTIAAGVAATTLLFALVNGVVLKPLPYPEPGDLVRIFDTNQAIGVERTGSTTGNVADWRRRADLFDGIAAFYTMGRTLTTGSDSEVVLTAQVSEDFFPLLRVPAAAGRTFDAEETHRGLFNHAAAPVGPDPVVVLGYRLWQRRFGGDPGVVGRTVMLERRPFRVVGVMPASFALPEPDVQLFIPWDLSGEQPRDQHYVSVLSRLRPGVTQAQAERHLAGVARTLAEEHPETNAGWSVRLVPLHEERVGDAGRLLFVLLGAVGVFLLVACANVALLALARGLERGRETSVRLALGATRGRILQQFVVESLVVAAAGGLLGGGLAMGGLAALQRFDPGLPRLQEVTLDARVLLFVLGVTMLSALLAGILPAWRRAQALPALDLEADARVRGGGPTSRLRGALVLGQVALSVVLIAGSGLLLRSFLSLRATPTGFDPRGVVVLPIFLDMQAYDSGQKARAYYSRLMERLAALPGVLSVGGATALPTSPLGPDFDRPLWPEEEGSPERARRAWVRIVTPGYFRTLGMAIREGRGFEERDTPESPLVVVVSEGLARRLWPGTSPVGHRVVLDYSTAGTYPYEVVGVVGDVLFSGPRSEPRLEIYMPHAQRPYLILNVAVRTTGDPMRLAPALQAVLHEIDPAKPAHGIHSLDHLLGLTFQRDRQGMWVAVTFAALAVLLAALSLHAMLALRVRERLGEIAVRIALGADRPTLLAWVAGYGLRLVVGGVFLGLALAAGVTRALAGVLFGVSPTDPATAVAAAALPLAIGLVACLLPAWRASRVDPVQVLRRG